MRIYLPATFDLTSQWLSAGQIPAVDGFAVTESLRDWYEQGDQEEFEYAATDLAARYSLEQIAQHQDATPRRVVLVLEVKPDSVIQIPDLKGGIRLSNPIEWSLVEAAMIDGDEAVADVKSAISLYAKAIAGDGEANFVVSQVEGHELLWFDSSEIEFVLQVDGNE